MTIINVARNNCGHHARVWNRTFALRVLTQRRMTRPWIAIPVNQKKAYFSLCIIKYFLDIISPNNDMKAKIDALLAEYPDIDTAAMGFSWVGKRTTVAIDTIIQDGRGWK